jgi:hypothetical protein
LIFNLIIIIWGKIFVWGMLLSFSPLIYVFLIGCSKH